MANIPFGAEATIFRPLEVGDYSIYICDNLDGLYQIGININGGKTYISKEILASSEGSVVYFDEKIIPDIKKGFFHNGWMQRYYYAPTPEILYREGKISLDDLFRIYKYQHNLVLGQLIYGKLK